MRALLLLMASTTLFVPASIPAAWDADAEPELPKEIIHSYATVIDGRPARVVEAYAATIPGGTLAEAPYEVRCAKGRVLLARACPESMIMACCGVYFGFIEFTDDTIGTGGTDRDGTVWVGSLEVSVAQGARRGWMRCENWVPSFHPVPHCTIGGVLDGYTVGAYVGLNINFGTGNGEGAATAFMRQD